MNEIEIVLILLTYAYLMIGIWKAANTINSIDDAGKRFIKGSMITIGWLFWLPLQRVHVTFKGLIDTVLLGSHAP